MNLNELRDEAYSIAKANGWHDMREKPEREDECLLVEYRDLGVDRSDYEVMLPDVTKETDQENCCGNCRHFMNEDINGNGWCSENDDETTCGQTCERWEDIP